MLIEPADDPRLLDAGLIFGFNSFSRRKHGDQIALGFPHSPHKSSIVAGPESTGHGLQCFGVGVERRDILGRYTSAALR